MAIPAFLANPQQGDPGHNSHHRYLHELAEGFVLTDRSRFYLPDDFVTSDLLGAPDGVATLDASGLVQEAQLGGAVVLKDTANEVVNLGNGVDVVDRIQLDYGAGQLLFSDGTNPARPFGGPVGGIFPDAFGDIPTFDVTAPRWGMDPVTKEIGAIINTISSFTAFLGPIRIFVPIGTYKIETKCILDSAVTLYGAGRNYTNLVLDATAFNATADATWFGIIQIGQNGEDVHSVTIRDLHIDGSRRSITATHFISGIYYTGPGEKREIRIQNVRVSDCTQYGLGLEGSGFQYGIYLDDIEIERVGADGIDQKGSTRGNARCFARNISISACGIYDVDNAAFDMRGEWSGVNITVYQARVLNAQGATGNIAIRFRSGQYDGGGNRQGARNCKLDNVKVYATGTSERFMVRAEPEQNPATADSLGAYGNYVNGVLIPPSNAAGVTVPAGVSQKGFPTPLAQAQSNNNGPTTLLTPTFSIDFYDVIEVVVVSIKTAGVGDAISGITHTFDPALTFAPLQTITQNSIRLSRFRAMLTADMVDATGALTVTWPAGQDFRYIAVTAWTGVSTATAAGGDAFVQGAVAQNGSGFTNAPVLAAAKHPDNICEHIFFVNSTVANVMTRETNWTRIHEMTEAAGRTLFWLWTPDFDATPTPTWTQSAQHLGIAEELRTVRGNLEPLV